MQLISFQTHLFVADISADGQYLWPVFGTKCVWQEPVFMTDMSKCFWLKVNI